MKQRYNYIDCLSGILIIHMILGHIMQWVSLKDSIFYIWSQRLLFFFMPWFFFKSGMFFKEKKFQITVKNSYKKLIIPLIVFSILGLPYYWLKLYINDDLNFIHYILSPIKSFFIIGNNVGNLPLWFLLALFGVLISYNFLYKKIHPVIIMLLSLLCGTIISNLNINIPFYFSNIFIGMAFYAAGNLMSKWQYKKNIRFVCIIIYILSVSLFPQFVDLRTNTLISGNYFLWFFIGCASCVAFNNIFKSIENIVPNFMVEIGKDSIIYYTIHWLIISYSTLIFNHFLNVKERWYMFLIILLSNIILLPICATLLKKNNNAKFCIGLK